MLVGKIRIPAFRVYKSQEGEILRGRRRSEWCEFQFTIDVSRAHTVTYILDLTLGFTFMFNSNCAALVRRQRCHLWVGQRLFTKSLKMSRCGNFELNCAELMTRGLFKLDRSHSHIDHGVAAHLYICRWRPTCEHLGAKTPPHGFVKWDISAVASTPSRRIRLN